jgi:hypothetical protein
VRTAVKEKPELGATAKKSMNRAAMMDLVEYMVMGLFGCLVGWFAMLDYEKVALSTKRGKAKCVLIVYVPSNFSMLLAGTNVCIFPPPYGIYLLICLAVKRGWAHLQ